MASLIPRWLHTVGKWTQGTRSNPQPHTQVAEAMYTQSSTATLSCCLGRHMKPPTLTDGQAIIKRHRKVHIPAIFHLQATSRPLIVLKERDSLSSSDQTASKLSIYQYLRDSTRVS